MVSLRSPAAMYIALERQRWTSFARSQSVLAANPVGVITKWTPAIHRTLRHPRISPRCSPQSFRKKCIRTLRFAIMTDEVLQKGPFIERGRRLIPVRTEG